MSMNLRNLRVLIVEDSEDDMFLTLRALRRGGYDVHYVRVDTPQAMQAALAEEVWDLVIADYTLPAFSAPAALQLLQSQEQDLPFIIVSGTIGEEVAVAAMKSGAHDYFIKGNLTRLVPAVARELREAAERQKQRETLQALRHSEIELREMSTALSNAVEGIARLDTQGCYLSVNEAYAQIVGYPAADMIGMDWQVTVHPDDLDRLQTAYHHMLEQGNVEVEAQGIRQDGSTFYKQLVMVTAYDEQQQFAGHYCFMKDITAAKQAEVVRAQTEQKMREQAALINIASDAIFVCDLANRIIFWNHGAQRLYGWTAEEVLGRNASALLYRELLPQVAEIPPAVFTAGEWQGELHKINKNDTRVIVATRLTLVRDDDGLPHSILSVDTDITEKKQLEAQFLRVQRLESLGTLASGIAHDFNNILTPILAIAQMMSAKSDHSAEQRHHLLKIMEDSAKRGAGLVKQILAFAQGVEGERLPLQVRHLLLEIVQVARQTFPKTIEIETSIPTTDLWPVAADATQLHQVLMNLCVNARDAMLEGGTLSLAAENRMIDESYARLNVEAHPGAYVAITITDTGMGIPTELLDRIFDPFFTTKELGKGTGLGLSTVLGIVKNHGGFVKVYSEVGSGTRFRVYLPAIAEPVNLDVLDDRSLTPGGQELVLIVDDEPLIQQVTQVALEAHNYRTLLASNGVEAIELYTQHQSDISVVLMDSMMPVMDGLTACRALQKINPQVRIVATSGLTSNSLFTEGESIGVRAFLPKPYMIEELLDKLQEVLVQPNATS
jgi:PAS domain S-box-containing protein